MIHARRQLGTGSYLGLLLWALLMVAFLPDFQLILVLASLVGFSLLNGGAGLRIVLHPRFWLFILSILALSPFVLGEPDVNYGAFQLSREGLMTGFQMVLRALVLMLTFSISLSTLTISQLVNLFDQVGLRGLGFALGVAFNLISVMLDLVASAYHTIRLRGGWLRPWRNATLFLVTVVANALRYGDDVVKAAIARAFDPAGPPPRPGQSFLSQLDKVFITGLLTVSVGLMLPIWT